MPPEPPLGILLISGGYERAHYAFVMAAGAAALGRPVVVFATNAGCHALCADFAGCADFVGGSDAEYQRRGLPDLATLRDAAVEFGVRLIACEAGLLASGVAAEALLPGVAVAGIVTFLGATAGGQLISL